LRFATTWAWIIKSLPHLGCQDLVEGEERGNETGEACSRFFFYKRERYALIVKDARTMIVVYTHLLRKLGRELGGMPFDQM
jgi:hypothetical protein